MFYLQIIALKSQCRSLPLAARSKSRKDMKRLIFALTISIFAIPSQTGVASRLDATLRDAFQYRNLGPFRAGAWVYDIAVPEAPLK
jgi:hypothetical protein